MNRFEDFILLNLIPGLDGAKVKRLLEIFGETEAIVRAPCGELAACGGIGQLLAEKIVSFPRGKLEEELQRIQREKARVLNMLDPGYPASLKEIAVPPTVLYLQGKLPDRPSLAIVGSRQASPYGLRLAERLGGEIAEGGLAVVSGFALGVDTAAHQGALGRGGETVAVLGSGLLNLYPPKNRPLAETILEKGGALVSEFPLTYPPLPENFPRRNRILSALSLGVCVVEAGEKSGALITANFALEQGREVFACPGPMESPLSRGCHRLIQQGAKLVVETEDIFEELKIPLVHTLSREMTKPALEPKEASVYDHLSYEPLSVDLVAERSQLPVQEAMSTLLQLELKQLVRAYPGKRFVKR